ncbi:MAG: BrnA antitoxin family protein [Steroidobacteraceae bacterium]
MRRQYDFSRAKRGAVVAPVAGKTRITIRLDDDILAWFKGLVDAAGGGNYQSMINAALREHMKRKNESLEATLRRVLREELQASS